MSEQADKELAALYLSLYFDEDVSATLTENIHTRSFRVQSARNVHMLGRDDEEQLAYAVLHRYTVVTHNRNDFEKLHYYYLATSQRHYGIVIAKRRRNEAVLVAKLLNLLNTVSAEEAENQLFYL
jgi:hypothetical protein